MKKHKKRGASKTRPIHMLPNRRNPILFLIGITMLAIGYLCLNQPPASSFLSHTLAPILLKVSYVVLIPLSLQDKGWTQVQTATFFCETQPRISNLMKGEISRFSVDKLIDMLARAGMRVKIDVEPTVA